MTDGKRKLEAAPRAWVLVVVLSMSILAPHAKKSPTACWKRVETRSSVMGHTLGIRLPVTVRGRRSAHRHARGTAMRKSMMDKTEADIASDMGWIGVHTETGLVTSTKVVLADCRNSSSRSQGQVDRHKWISRDVLRARLGKQSVNIARASAQTASSAPRRKGGRRQKREICGMDNRREIKHPETNYPGAAVVKVLLDYTVCTGTLISPLHVLTAAHCVYNNTAGSYNLGFRNTRIGLPRLHKKSIMMLKRVVRIDVPRRWIEPKLGQHAEYDFAVLTLRHCLRQPYMKVSSVPSRWERMPQPQSAGECQVRGVARNHTNLNMIAFAEDRPNTSLWWTSCMMQGVQSGLLRQHCDAKMGSSGAALYTHQPERVQVAGRVAKRIEHRIRGVFIGHQPSPHFNVGLAITEKKRAMICHWTNACDLPTWGEITANAKPFKRRLEQEYKGLGCKVKRRWNSKFLS